MRSVSPSDGSGPPGVSSLTLNRLSVYLRSLRRLQEEGVQRVSSGELAERFHLSAPQIRKDLAQFGEFGIRGVGYEIEPLIDRLHCLLGLDCRRNTLVIGAGSLGHALARYLGARRDCFRVVGCFDVDAAKIGTRIDDLVIESMDALADRLETTGAELAVLTVPASAAPETYDLLVRAGVRGVLNFAPVRLEPRPGVHVRNVDMRVYLEELAFLLR